MKPSSTHQHTTEYQECSLNVRQSNWSQHFNVSVSPSSNMRRRPWVEGLCDGELHALLAQIQRNYRIQLGLHYSDYSQRVGQDRS